MARMSLNEARSYVLQKFILLELRLNKIISTFYIGNQSAPIYTLFQMQVLHDTNCSFGLKRHILEKILSYVQPNKDDNFKRQLQNLNTLNRIRNIFAHTSGSHVFKPDENTRIPFAPDPDAPERQIDFASKLKAFVELYPETAKWLDDLHKRIPDASNEAGEKFLTALKANIKEINSPPRQPS